MLLWEILLGPISGRNHLNSRVRRLIVQSAPFGANPQIAVLVFDGAAYNRIAQPLLFDGRIHIAAVYLVLGVEVVDAAKVGPQPQRSLVVLYDAPDGRVCQSVALGITGSVVPYFCHTGSIR